MKHVFAYPCPTLKLVTDVERLPTERFPITTNPDHAEGCIFLLRERVVRCHG